MDKPVIIFGSKGIAEAALEIFESNGVVVYGFLDDDKSLHGTEINAIPVLSDTEDHGYLKLIGGKMRSFCCDGRQFRATGTCSVSSREKKSNACKCHTSNGLYP